MLDGEGSVEVDGEGFEPDQVDGEGSVQDESEGSDGLEENQNSESTNTDTETENLDNQENDTKQETDSGDTEDSKDQDEDGKTEKGTKLDPDPLSQANQLRANAEAKTREYEEFFSDPKKVKSYLEELEKESGEDQEEDEDLVTDPSKIETTADMQSYAKFLKKEQDKALNEMRKSNEQREQKERTLATVSRVGSQIGQVKQKYPELRELNPDGSKNPDFDPELEAELGALIEDVDFDPNIVNPDGSKGNFRGAVDYVKLADRFMKAAKRGQAQGSKKAQTIVKDKSGGRIKGGGSAGEGQPDESSMTASQVIAARMARARGRK